MKKIIIFFFIGFIFSLTNLLADEISDCLELEKLKAETREISRSEATEISQKICGIRARLGWSTEIAKNFDLCMKKERIQSTENEGTAYNQLVEDAIESCHNQAKYKAEIKKEVKNKAKSKEQENQAENNEIELDEVHLNRDNVFFLYESRVGYRISDHEIALLISRDYRRASNNEFLKRKILNGLKPTIEESLRKAKKIKAVNFYSSHSLGKYDFDKEHFLLNYNYTGVSVKYPYNVNFINNNKLKFFPVSLEKAEKFSSSLSQSRRIKITIHGIIVGAVETARRKVVKLKITRAEIFLERTGEKIGEIIVN